MIELIVSFYSNSYMHSPVATDPKQTLLSMPLVSTYFLHGEIATEVILSVCYVNFWMICIVLRSIKLAVWSSDPDSNNWLSALTAMVEIDAVCSFSTCTDMFLWLFLNSIDASS